MTDAPRNRDRAGQLYDRLLRLYPRRFRRLYAAGMRETFARDHARLLAEDRGSRVRFWARTMAEAAWFGLAERVQAPSVANHQTPGRNHAMRFTIMNDCRDAVRSLRATPVIAAIAVLSLALGIGANTALFSILNSLVLKTLPVREPAQLALLDQGSWTNPIWEQIRARQDELFDGAFAWSSERFNLAERGQTDFAEGAYASGRLFDVLGVSAARGRVLLPSDDIRTGGPNGPAAVLSYGFWQRRFGGADDAIGRSVVVDGVPFTVVGVLPQGFSGPDVGRSIDLYLPLGSEALVHGKETLLDGRSTWWLQIMVRMKPGQHVDEATARLRQVQPEIRRATQPDIGAFGKRYLSEPLTLLPAGTGRSPLRRVYQQPLTIIMVVVAAVLLIACANIANLLLARATARRQELVVRLALGASRLRLGRQLLIESLLLSLAGALLGLGFARAGSALLVHQLARTGSSVYLDTSIDMRVLLFTAGVSIVTALVFGLAPAIGVVNVAPNEVLKEHGRGVRGDRRFGFRNGLVIAQVALSLTLVVAGGIFVRTFVSLMSVPLGFTPEPLTVVQLNVQRSAVAPAERVALFARLRDAAMQPGVERAALGLIRPLSGMGWNTMLELPGTPLSERQRMSWINGVSPGWFETYGMRLLAGRDFTEMDRRETPEVAVVNQTFAARFLGTANPVGRSFATRGPSELETFQIVGLVADSVYRSPREDPAATFFVPVTQMHQAGSNMNLTIKLAPGSHVALERSLGTAFARVDSHVAFTIQPYSALVGDAVSQERLIAMLAGFFGALALLLAALGLYGVTSYSVNRQRTEIGVRLALGAQTSGVMRLVLGRVCWLVGAGVVAGAGLSWWASRFVRATLLFGLQPRDPETFVLAAIVLIAVGGFAGWLPARRASRLDAAQVLREG